MYLCLFLFVCRVLLQSPGALADCGPCDLKSCAPLSCAVPELLVKDACGCCKECLGVEGSQCGGKKEEQARCSPGLVCMSHSEEGSGLCLCKEEGMVCGSDGQSYPSVCALHLQSWISLHSAKSRIHKVHDGECKLAPVVVMPPKRIHNVTGSQVYLSCEVKAVPTPIITWRKVMESPKGVKVLEEMPGDRVNIAVQVRGGPLKHESTGWVL
ncbi:insulin-like growth factor-binding protein-like 1 isoform X2 [Latimeria chalumnae]